MSERAPQWERDNGLPGRHALSSPVPPRSCHSSLIAQNGLLRDCCLPLRHSLPFPFPRRRGAAMATPAPRPAGRPRQAGAERAASPRPSSVVKNGQSKVFPRRLLEEGSRQCPCAGTCSGEDRGAAPPGQPWLLLPCPGLREPAGFFLFCFSPESCMFIETEPNIAMDIREYLGAMRSPLKVRQGRNGGARLWGTPRGALPKLGARTVPPSSGSLLLPLLASCPPPQNFPKYQLPLSEPARGQTSFQGRRGDLSERQKRPKQGPK